MAETVKVEIAIAATDNTAMGISSVQGKLNALDRSFQKIQRQIDKLTGSRCKVDLDAHDNASDKIADVDDALQKTNGREANIDVGANDGATGILNSVEGTVDELNGEGAVVEAEAEDAATGVLSDVEGTLSELNGETAVVEAEAEDAASGTIDEVEQKVNALDGSSATVLIQAENQAEGAIRDAAGAARAPIAETAAVMGASFGVYDSISTFAGFEAGMSQVAAISGATGAELDALTAKAKQMGASTKFTATESAEAFNYMAMAGWKTDDMLGGIEGVMNLAAASGESLATTSDIVTDALTAFGMKASDSTHFADVMAQASANANTNVGMLGESFKYVAPVAGAMGYTIEDTALALGLMANAGVKSSMAGTALRRAISALTSPTDKQANAMEKYGISLTNSDGSIKSLNEVMGDLRTNLSGLSEDEKTAAISQMFGSQAMAGMLAIINASEDDFNKMSDAVNNAEGAAKSMADTMLDNLQGSFTLMQSAIEGVENSLGERLAPYMRGLANAITASMPDATKAIEDVMDKVDSLAEKFRAAMKTMVNSEEWENADFLGKIDIAWDTMIAQPFKKWAETDGASMISTGISTLFSEAVKILPGGEDAGLSSWLSAGLIAGVATKLAGAIGSVSSAATGLGEAGGIIGSFGSTIGPAIPYIAGAALAIGGLAVAIDSYNSKKIESSLQSHFGDVELTRQQISEIAGAMVDVEFTANVELSLGMVNGADECRSEAEKALQSNDALEWKSSVGLTLTEDEQASYAANVQTFIDSKKGELEQQFSGMTLAINTVIDKENSTGMIQSLSAWYEEDQAELSNLSAKLSKAVENALKDGIIDVDEQGAINALQDKINNILSSWNESKSQTQLDLIKQKYGHLTGADLTSGSFSDIIASYQAQRETQEAELAALSEQYYDLVNSASTGPNARLSKEEANDWKDKWMQGVWGQRGSSLVNALSFEGNTLSDVYGTDYTKGRSQAQSNAQSAAQQLIGDYERGDYSYFADRQARITSGNEVSGASAISKDNRGAMQKLYEEMKPDVTAMQNLIDDYRSEGAAIPQNLIDAYNEAINTGAAVGDAEAGYQQLANELISQGSAEFVDALTNPDNEMYSTLRQNMPEALQDAVDRAAYESEHFTTDPIEIDGLLAEVKEITADDSGLEEAAQKAVDELPPPMTTHKATARFEIEETETDPEQAYNEAEQETQDRFGEPMNPKGSANVELSQANNADAIYSEVANDVQGRFNSAISAHGTVNVTLKWHITNPSASINVSTSGGSAHATINSATMANGGFVNGAILSWIGEAGPEYVIPVGANRRGRGAELWTQAGEALGMFDGGEDAMLANPFEEDKSTVNPLGSLLAAAGSSDKGNGDTTNGVNVNVSMNPVIQIDGSNMNEDDIFNVMKRRIKECADDVGYEVGEKLAKIFSNMPLAQGV